MNKTYRVVVKGLMPGQPMDRVAQEMSGLFKLPVEQTKALLLTSGLTVKRGLDVQTAAKYQAALEQRGCACLIEPESSRDASSPESRGSESSEQSIGPASVRGSASSSVPQYAEPTPQERARDSTSVANSGEESTHQSGKPEWVASLLAQPTSLCAAALLAFFFLPWVDFGVVSIPGYRIPWVVPAELGLLKLILLLPLLSAATIGLAIANKDTSIAALAMAAIPICGFFYALLSTTSESVSLYKIMASGAWLTLITCVGAVILALRQLLTNRSQHGSNGSDAPVSTPAKTPHPQPGVASLKAVAEAFQRMLAPVANRWGVGAGVVAAAAAVVIALWRVGILGAADTVAPVKGGAGPTSQLNDLVLLTFEAPARFNMRELAGMEAGGQCEEFKDPAVKTVAHGTMSRAVPLNSGRRLPAVIAQVDFTCEHRLLGFRKRVSTWVVVAYDAEFDTPRCQFVSNEETARKWAVEQCGFKSPTATSGSQPVATAQAANAREEIVVKGEGSLPDGSEDRYTRKHFVGEGVIQRDDRPGLFAVFVQGENRVQLGAFDELPKQFSRFVDAPVRVQIDCDVLGDKQTGELIADSTKDYRVTLLQ